MTRRHPASRRLRPAAALLIGLAGLPGGGCAAPAGPSLLTLDSSIYPVAFDAAVDAARAEGMSAALRDRRGGVIETEPSIVGSMLEPWRTVNDTPAQVIEGTLALERRRARFEFVPVGFRPTADDQEPPGGPDVVGLRPADADLSRHEGELELRVWVYVERAHTPGIRRSTWSRSLTTRTRVPDPSDPERFLPAIFWTPIARDPQTERQLLGQVQAALMRKGTSVAAAISTGSTPSPP